LPKKGGGHEAHGVHVEAPVDGAPSPPQPR